MKRRTPVRIIGVLAVLLAFAAALGVVGAAPAFADWESEATAPQQRELTGIVLKDLDAPVAGEKLDDTATAETDQGVTWEVPVVWCDLYGNDAAVADAGRTYVPTFAFIAPDGYTVKRATNGSFKLRLPEFLEKRFGYDKLVFIEDKATGVTFITFNVLQAVPSQPAASTAATNAPAAAPEPAAEEAAEPAPEPAKDEVLLHCTPYAINRVGRDNLQELIDLIKNVIEPRAVAALAEAFPALAQAIEDGTVGREISFYVYDTNGDTQAADGRNLEGAVAYISGGYMGPNEYKYIFGVNTATLYELRDGKMVFKESERKTLENTITHEVLHGLMDDYVRTGMSSYEYDPLQVKNHFPQWFMEGSATAVENGFQYWAWYLEQMKAGDAHFTKANVATYFGGDQFSFNRRLDGTEEMTGGYLGGSLATIYLSKLVAGSDASGANVNSATVRNGFNTILSQIHNGKSLDAIIRDTGKYAGVQDFEAKFLKGDDPSAQFCVDYLNRLDALEVDGNRATGSILADFSSLQKSVLDGRTEDRSTQQAFVLNDENDYFQSTVPDDKAKESAGTFHTWQNDKDNPQQQAQSEAAAKPDVTSAQAASEPAADSAQTAPEPAADTAQTASQPAETSQEPAASSTEQAAAQTASATDPAPKAAETA